MVVAQVFDLVLAGYGLVCVQIRAVSHLLAREVDMQRSGPGVGVLDAVGRDEHLPLVQPVLRLDDEVTDAPVVVEVGLIDVSDVSVLCTHRTSV